jgi:hypothetical protein
MNNPFAIVLEVDSQFKGPHEGNNNGSPLDNETCVFHNFGPKSGINGCSLFLHDWLIL